ncbi:hypothetical protein [Methylococcus capsulatus]|uniref:hypothetical protein n=1 Tax=Methylococcus capsulatus TaxID=414 RepID=UPI00211ABBAB|nr:hypothetical protein [Methylococcus capsulatus]
MHQKLIIDKISGLAATDAGYDAKLTAMLDQAPASSSRGRPVGRAGRQVLRHAPHARRL